MAIKVNDEKRETVPDAEEKVNGNYYRVEVNCNNNVKGEWDYNAWNLKLDGVVQNSKCTLAFTSNMSATEKDNIIKQGVQIRRNTYRGKDITELWQSGELYSQIESGKFDDIYVGDYIVSNTNDKWGNKIVWLIADLDNYLGTGDKDNGLETHHATIIPAYKLQESRMNSTATIDGAYKESEMYKVTLGTELKADENTILGKYIYPDFKEHVLKYRTLVSNAMEATRSNQWGQDTGASSGWSWEDRYLDLMSEANVYGTTVWSSSGYDIGIDNRQYAIFQLRPELINQGVSGISDTNTGRYWYWLKAVLSSTTFAGVDGFGSATYNSAAGWGAGVRPRFLID